MPSKSIRARCLLLLSMLFAAAPAAATELRDVRVWDGPQNTRVVFDLSGAAAHRVFTLADPERVVIDLDGVSPGEFSNDLPEDGVIAGPRSARQPDGRLRVVLDLSRDARASRRTIEAIDASRTPCRMPSSNTATSAIAAA